MCYTNIYFSPANMSCMISMKRKESGNCLHKECGWFKKKLKTLFIVVVNFTLTACLKWKKKHIQIVDHHEKKQTSTMLTEKNTLCFYVVSGHHLSNHISRLSMCAWLWVIMFPTVLEGSTIWKFLWKLEKRKGWRKPSEVNWVNLGKGIFWIILFAY